MLNIATVTASEARADLYSLIKSAGKGLKSYEITLRGEVPVVLMSKAELESWMETLDVLNSPSEIKAVRKARKEKGSVPHSEMLKAVGL